MSKTARGGGHWNWTAGPVATAPMGVPAAVLIVFGTTEGHTRVLAEFAASRLAADGAEVTLRDAAEMESPLDLDRFGAIFVAASIHWRRYQNSVTGFALRHQEALNGAHSAFISASLAAAGVPQPEGFTLDDCVGVFERETQWRPKALHHVGGGIGHSAYDYFKCLAATLIAQRRDDRLGATQDYDLADYDALAAFVLMFAGQAAGAPART